MIFNAKFLLSFSLFVVAKSKMDLMLSSDTAWQSQYQGLMEMDETNLPECAESFITLMLTITGENYICTVIF